MGSHSGYENECWGHLQHGPKDIRDHGEDRVNELIDELMRADLVVGFNHIRFDYEVLHGYTVLDLSQAPSLDLMLDLQKTQSPHFTGCCGQRQFGKKPQKAFRRLNGSSRRNAQNSGVLLF